MKIFSKQLSPLDKRVYQGEIININRKPHARQQNESIFITETLYEFITAFNIVSSEFSAYFRPAELQFTQVYHG